MSRFRNRSLFWWFVFVVAAWSFLVAFAMFAGIVEEAIRWNT